MKLENSQQKYSGIYQELVDLLGIQAVDKLYKNYRGQQVVFPMRLLTRNYVIAQLHKDFDGTNLKALALEYGYTERYLRTLLDRNEES